MDYTNVKVGSRKEDLYEISNPDFLFFWGHHGKPGETTKACLSQWYLERESKYHPQIKEL